MSKIQVNEILQDKSISNWLKKAIQSGLNRDCVDFKYDAELLARIAQEHCNEVFSISAVTRSTEK